MGLGMRAMCQDMGVDMGVDLRLKVYSDTSAAIGIAMRRGIGKVRHIEVHHLWLRDRVGRWDVLIEKVHGEKNPADALTKHVESLKINYGRDWIKLVVLQGRHELMPSLTQD